MAKWGDLYKVEENKVDWISNRIRPSVEILMPEKIISSVTDFVDITPRNIQPSMTESLNPGVATYEIINQREIQFTAPSTATSTPYLFLEAIGPNVLEAGKEYTVTFLVTVLSSNLVDPNVSYNFRHGLRFGGYADQSLSIPYNEEVLIKHTFIPADVAGNLRLILFSGSYPTNPKFRIRDVKIAQTTEESSYVPSVKQVGGEEAYQQRYMQPVVTNNVIPKQFIDYPLGIFLVSTPKKQEEGASIVREIEAYDKLLILKEDKITKRLVFAAGKSYYDCITETIKSTGNTKYNIERTDKKLTTTKEYDPGTEKLVIINELLSDLNYTPVHVDEYGYFMAFPYISPSDRSIDYEYLDDDISVTYVGMEEELDLFELPNVVQVTVTNPDLKAPLTAEVINNNRNHPRSVVNLGRRIVRFEEKDDIADQAALNAYAQRLMFETSQIFGKVEFSTSIMPFHGYQNVLRIRNNNLGIDDIYSETDWKMSLNPTGDNQMTHSARRVVNIV